MQQRQKAGPQSQVFSVASSCNRLQMIFQQAFCVYEGFHELSSQRWMVMASHHTSKQQQTCKVRALSQKQADQGKYGAQHHHHHNVVPAFDESAFPPPSDAQASTVHGLHSRRCTALNSSAGTAARHTQQQQRQHHSQGWQHQPAAESEAGSFNHQGHSPQHPEQTAPFCLGSAWASGGA